MWATFTARPSSYVDAAMEQGRDVILDIEIQGAQQVYRQAARRRCAIFIAPPSWAELERRLTGRGTDDMDKVQKRLLRAKVELKMADSYDYFVINDTVENAVREINAIMLAEHCRPSERMEMIADNDTYCNLSIMPRRGERKYTTMMLYPAMNTLTKNVPNRYLLVNVVARRARQHRRGRRGSGGIST